MKIETIYTKDEHRKSLEREFAKYLCSKVIAEVDDWFSDVAEPLFLTESYFFHLKLENLKERIAICLCPWEYSDLETNEGKLNE